MEKYGEYKDSGVKWLGQIPSHWDVLSLKHILKLKKTLVGKNSSQYDLLSLTLKGIIKRDMENPEGKFPASFDAYQVVEPNDFVFCNFDNEETPRAVGLSKYKGMITGAYDVLCRKNPKLTDKYLIYYFLYIDDAKRFKPLYKGLRKTVPFDSFMSYKIPVPSLKEQEEMVSYLDVVTSKIDEAIAQQQKMIDLLNERKQIIINEAVTKGLDPKAKMKDSGIDWIGKIPEHWDVIKLGALGLTINGVSHDSTYFGTGYPFVSYSDVYKNYSLPQSVVGLANSTVQERSYFSVEEGDVFFTRTSETAEEIGFASTCLKTIPDAVFAGFLIRFRPQKKCLNKFFSKYYFRANIHRNYFVKEMNLVIRASLSQQLLKGLPILLPSLKEQEEIANYLNQKTQEIDECLENAKKLIALLQERKQIIINDVVTGKVKVA